MSVLGPNHKELRPFPHPPRALPHRFLKCILLCPLHHPSLCDLCPDIRSQLICHFSWDVFPAPPPALGQMLCFHEPDASRIFSAAPIRALIKQDNCLFVLFCLDQQFSPGGDFTYSPAPTGDRCLEIWGCHHWKFSIAI